MAPGSALSRRVAAVLYCRPREDNRQPQRTCSLYARSAPLATPKEEIVAQIDPRCLEVVIAQYARREVGLAKAASLLGLHVSEFQLVAAGRGVDLAITPEDLANDVATLRRLGQLR